MTELAVLYSSLYQIRRFEEMVLENFPTGVFYGTTHAYLGQEANAVGVLSNIKDEDVVFSNHRGHGHYLAIGGDPRRLFAELMGKASGVCGGRGGSQHLHWRSFYSNGIQGGIVPIATGMAMAEKMKQSSSIVIAFLGDGTLGEGVVYEAFNLATLWQAPILYVLENNHIAQTTPSEIAVAGKISSRFNAFGIPSWELDTSDVLDILPVADELITKVRLEITPCALILNTCRFGPHSKGDDTRPPEEVEEMRLLRDPINITGARLGSLQRTKIEAGVEAELQHAYQLAMLDPLPDPTIINQNLPIGHSE